MERNSSCLVDTDISQAFARIQNTSMHTVPDNFSYRIDNVRQFEPCANLNLYRQVLIIISIVASFGSGWMNLAVLLTRAKWQKYVGIVPGNNNKAILHNSSKDKAALDELYLGTVSFSGLNYVDSVSNSNKSPELPNTGWPLLHANSRH